jgi:hypothetical protein
MPHDPIGGYPGHGLLGVVYALSPAEKEGESDGIGQVLGVGCGQLVILGHRRTTAKGRERSKNKVAAKSPAPRPPRRGANRARWLPLRRVGKP